MGKALILILATVLALANSQGYHAPGSAPVRKESNVYVGEDGYLYTDMEDWLEATLQMVNGAYSKESIWAEELDLEDYSPQRSFLRDDLVLLFGEDWGNNVFFEWEAILDKEDELEEEDVPTFHPPIVDKYFQNMLDISNDPDCMEGEVDFSADEFVIEKAIKMWHKCHLLVLRNVFTDAQGFNVAQEFARNATKFVHDVNAGRVNDNGTTTYSEPMFMHDVEVNRWDMLLPKSLASHPQVLAPEKLMRFLEDERVLGDSFKALSFGLVMAEPGASSQMWHQDERPMFGDGSIFHYGHGGHETPAVQMVALAPLINMTRSHGPTEFCLGSSAVNGLFTDYFNLMTWKDPNLKEKVLDMLGGHPEERFLYDFCPSKMWRSPLLNVGDMVLWDYNLNHRAGPNDSADFRSAMYTSYARRTVQDRTFESFEDQPGNQPRNADGSVEMKDFVSRSIRKGRFAKISLSKNEPSSVPTANLYSQVASDEQCPGPRSSALNGILFQTSI